MWPNTSWILLRVMGSHWSLHMHVLNTSKWGPWERWCKSQTHRSRQRSSCECDGKGWICRVVVLTEPGFTLLIVKPVHSWGETTSDKMRKQQQPIHAQIVICRPLKNMIKWKTLLFRGVLLFKGLGWKDFVKCLKEVLCSLWLLQLTKLHKKCCSCNKINYNHRPLFTVFCDRFKLLTEIIIKKL